MLRSYQLILPMQISMEQLTNHRLRIWSLRCSNKMYQCLISIKSLKKAPSLIKNYSITIWNQTLTIRRRFSRRSWIISYSKYTNSKMHFQGGLSRRRNAIMKMGQTLISTALKNNHLVLNSNISLSD